MRHSCKFHTSSIDGMVKFARLVGKRRDRLILCTESGLFLIALRRHETSDGSGPERPPTASVVSSVTCHSVLSCSVAWQPRGCLLASGGMGEVLIWRTSESGSAPPSVAVSERKGADEAAFSPHASRSSSDWNPAHCIPTNNLVRSIAWTPAGDMVVYGLLDGAVLSWRIPAAGDVDGTPRDTELCPDPDGSSVRVSETECAMFAMEGGVTCMRFSPRGLLSNGIVLAASDTTGRVTLWSMSIQRELGSVRHSEGLEVWSVAWKPRGLPMLATAGEDQLVVIWRVGDDCAESTRVTALVGHTMAVTSVDWSVTAIGEVLASVSDDRSVRLYDASGEDFPCLHVFKTHGLYLTYVRLETADQHGGEENDEPHDRICCCTEDGFLHMWCLRTKKRMLQMKLHGGSVEGLDWDSSRNLVASCGSDCSVMVTCHPRGHFEPHIDDTRVHRSDRIDGWGSQESDDDGDDGDDVRGGQCRNTGATE
eukprot:Opistho-2@85519